MAVDVTPRADVGKAPRKLGRVAHFVERKGIGFISPQDGGPDVYVHFSELQGLTVLHPGQEVEFGVVPDRKGTGEMAVEVREPRARYQYPSRASYGPHPRPQRDAPRRAEPYRPHDAGPLQRPGPMLPRPDMGRRPEPYSRAAGPRLPLDGPGRDGYGPMREDRRARAPPPPPSFHAPLGRPGDRGRQALQTGRVARFIEHKGIGYISPPDGSPDVYVHVSEVSRPDGTNSLVEGEEVEYSVVPDRKGTGWMAVGVRPRARPAPYARPPARRERSPRGPVAGGRRRGIVAKFVESKGIGYLAPDEGGPDVYFHISAVADRRDLVPGEPVEFSTVPDRRGTGEMATDVVRL